METVVEKLRGLTPFNDVDLVTIEEACTRIERMEMALRDAQRQFLFYERNHRVKVGDMATIVETQQTIEKAETNATMAKICGDALMDGEHDPREYLFLAMCGVLSIAQNVIGVLPEDAEEAISAAESAKQTYMRKSR